MATTLSDLSGWAGQILDSLNETGIATGSTVLWLTSNLGKLNSYIGSGFYYSGEAIYPDMDASVSGIYTEMYYCYYLDRQANKFLGAAGYDWTSIDGSEQGSIRKVSRNEQAKTYRMLANDCQARMKELIDFYKSYASSPVYQILYSDRWGGADYGLIDFPSTLYYNTCCAGSH